MGDRGIHGGLPEAADVRRDFGALIAGASSRIRPGRSTRDLGRTPTRTDMLDTIGESRLRGLASPSGEGRRR